MRATFFDPEYEAALERDGYAVLPLLDPEEIDRLKAAYADLGPAPGDGRVACHSSFHSFDQDYKRRVDDVVRSVLSPHLERTFDRQRALPCNFIIKWPGAMGGFGLHQDLSLVDETEHRSVEVWVALDATDGDNGQLWMVPGSHRWLPGNIRGIHAFPFAFESVTQRIVQEFAIPVPVPAGHAVVFNHATLHFSQPNRTDRPRLVAITDLIPEEAPHLHYFGDGEGMIEAFAIDDAFWVENSPFTLWQPPARRQCLGTVDAVAQVLTDTDLDRLEDDGIAIRSELHPRGAINAGKAWCHRCGTTDFDAGPVDRWVGNVTLLCPACASRELEFAHTAEHVGPDAASVDLDALDRDGWTTFPLLAEDEVAEWRGRCLAAVPDEQAPFHSSANHADRSTAAAVADDIIERLAPRLEKLFPAHRVFIAGYLHKGAASGEVDFHQDLTYTDERVARAVILWIPLVDVEPSNGAIRAVRGSHTWTSGIRPGGGDWSPLDTLQTELLECSEPIPMSAGTALAWDPALIHGSSANDGADSRPALAIGIVPQDADLLHFHRAHGGPTEGFAIADDFFVTVPFRERPAGEPTVEPWTPDATIDEFVGALAVRRAGGAELGAWSSSPPASRPVLLDDSLDEQLQRDGFVTVPVIDAAAARRLRDEFFRLRGVAGNGFHSDLVVEDPAYREAADRVLEEALDASAAALFEDHEPFLRSFLCKYPGEESSLYLHQDWMYVDERTGERTHAVWIALDDITGHNGQLRVLRGSHRLDDGPRGSDLIAPWIHAEGLVEPRLLSVPVPAGHGVVFDNALVHSSYPNNTSEPRLAVAIGLRRRGTPLVHFRRSPNGHADRYDVDPDFFLRYSPQSLLARPPALPIVESVTVPVPPSAEVIGRQLDEGRLAKVDRLYRAVGSGRDWSRRMRSAARTTAEQAQDAAGRRLAAAPEQAATLRGRLRELVENAPSMAAIGVLGANEFVINRFGPSTRAVWDPSEFEWSDAIVASYEAIRAEVEALLAGPTEIPHIEDVTGGIPQGNEGPWRSLVLMHQGRWIDWNCDRCPATTAAVRQIPGLMMAGFSVLEPGTHITEHRGPNKGALRYQLGVIVPGAEGDCRIRVGDEMLFWRNGEAVAFDFTVPHEAWNDSDSTRVLLMLEVLLPGLPRYLEVPNRLALRAMGWFPTTRNMKRRLAALEPSLAKRPG